MDMSISCIKGGAIKMYYLDLSSMYEIERLSFVIRHRA